MTGLDTDDFLSLVNGGVRISNAVPIIESAWTVKTEDELTIYRHIGEQYARTMQVSRESIHPGVTENQLSATVTAAWYDTGGEGLLQINVCAGEDMNPWRRWPSQRAIADGEFVGIDLHGRSYAGLHGDATRTYFVGDHPTPEQRDLYRRAYDYIKAMTSVIEAGLSIAEICERAPRIPDEYREALWDLNLAHAIGPGASGEPRLDPRKPRKDVVLEPNQVLSVECYFGQKGSPLAVKLEDDIIVRDGPPELLGPTMPYDERFIG
ncbi:MAG: aminopeptidase family protein [Chloroflexi bacterium]|nr:aminopeptidase family protein [Chloroflexota bacterium]